MSWPLASLGEVAPSKPLKNPDILDENSVWQLNLDKVESHSGLVTEKVYGSVQSAGSSTHWFDERHVLYSKLRPYLNKVVLPEEQGLATTELVPLFPDKDRLDRKYLTYYLRSNRFVEWISDQVAGAKMPRVSMKVFWEHQIPLPPLDEQKRIAAILDKADAIRRKRQQAIDLADDFLRSVFLDMFGDPAINPNTYDETTLGELKVEKMNNGIFKKNGEYGGETPVAWVSELFRGRNISFRPDSNSLSPTVNEVEKYGLRFGDLLFCRSSLKLEGIGFNNVYLGKDNEALFECHLIRLRPDFQKVDPVFLNYQLRMPNIRKRVFQQSKTVTMTTIDQEGLSNVKVVVPPLDEQKKFMEIVKSTELILNKTENTVSLNNDSFNSLSQKAFAGEL